MKEKLTYLFPGLVPTFMTTAAVVAILSVSATGPIAPGPAYADHNSLYLICPDPIPEGSILHRQDTSDGAQSRYSGSVRFVSKHHIPTGKRTSIPRRRTH